MTCGRRDYTASEKLKEDLCGKDSESKHGLVGFTKKSDN